MEERIQHKLNLWANFTVAVVGDIITDVWYECDDIKISPEAPVLDLISPRIQAESPGGAANVAMNVRALGARCWLYGVYGQLDMDTSIIEAMRLAGVALCDQSETSATRKVRFSCRGQPIMRTSHESQTLAFVAWETICSVDWSMFDAIIIADYNKGMMTPQVIAHVMMTDAARGTRVPVFVDPKFDNFKLYKGAEVIKCNELEAQAFVCGLLRTPKYDTLISTRWGACIAQQLETKNVVITRGKDGINVTNMQETGDATWVPGRPVTAVDVTGAGDTAIAVLTLEYLRTGDIVKSAWLANYACSLVVQERRTAVPDAEDLENYLQEAE